MKTRSLSIFLLFLDFVFSTLSWVVFYFLRKKINGEDDFHLSDQFYWGVILVPLFWLFVFYLQGTYFEVKRLYRIKIVNLTFVGTLIGTIILFFALLLDDEIKEYQSYYLLFSNLFLCQLLFLLVPRFVFVSLLVKRLHSSNNGFRTLIIGGSENAVKIYQEINSLPRINYNLIGFVNLNGVDKLLEDKIKYLGHFDAIDDVLEKHDIEEVIIALESNEHSRIKHVLDKIEGRNIRINIIPDMYDILSGMVKMTNIFGALLIQVDAYSMPIWQKAIKRFMDVIISLLALVILLPFYLVMAVLVKISSPGPIFFFQERIGLNGQKFKIVKYRTMFIDAEKFGPQLSSSNDPRITPIGRIMRKLRLDEFPQFYNVLIGDMSLVGPRPERDFYIEKIVEIEPQFRHLTKVRPGITSWGQVKFGYAENIDQMIQRMKFDLLYLKNRTLALDIKILLYTVIVIIKGKGK